MTHAGMFTALASALAKSASAPLRLRRRGRGTGHQRVATALLRRARRRPARTLSSSPATSASGSSSSPFRGNRSASISAAGPGPCASTTARPTRSGTGRPPARSGSDRCGRQHEDRSDTISVFNGPAPIIRVHRERRLKRSEPSEHGLPSRLKAGVQPHEFGVFVRSTGATGARPSRRRGGRSALQDSRRARRDDQRSMSPSARCTWPRVWNSALSR